MTLDDWITSSTGPGSEYGTRPSMVICRDSKKHLPLSTIPIRYRCDTIARTLIAADVFDYPWNKPYNHPPKVVWSTDELDFPKILSKSSQETEIGIDRGIKMLFPPNSSVRTAKLAGYAYWINIISNNKRLLKGESISIPETDEDFIIGAFVELFTPTKGATSKYDDLIPNEDDARLLQHDHKFIPKLDLDISYGFFSMRHRDVYLGICSLESQKPLFGLANESFVILALSKSPAMSVARHLFKTVENKIIIS